MGIDSIVKFARDLLVFFRSWAIYIAYAMFFGNLVLFVNSAISDIYSKIHMYSWDGYSGGTFFHNILTVISMVVPANVTAVLSLVVSIQLLKLGLILYISLQKLYWDMLFYLNK